MTLTTVVQIARLVQCDFRVASGVTSRSMALFAVLMTIKKIKDIVSGSNIGMRNVSNLLQTVIESIRILSTKL